MALFIFQHLLQKYAQLPGLRLVQAYQACIVAHIPAPLSRDAKQLLVYRNRNTVTACPADMYRKPHAILSDLYRTVRAVAKLHLQVAVLHKLKKAVPVGTV